VCVPGGTFRRFGFERQRFFLDFAFLLASSKTATRGNNGMGKSSACVLLPVWCATDHAVNSSARGSLLLVPKKQVKQEKHRQSRATRAERVQDTSCHGRKKEASRLARAVSRETRRRRTRRVTDDRCGAPHTATTGCNGSPAARELF